MCSVVTFICSRFIAMSSQGPSPSSTAAQPSLHNIGMAVNIWSVLLHSTFNHSKSGLPKQFSAQNIRRTETGVLKRKKLICSRLLPSLTYVVVLTPLDKLLKFLTLPISFSSYYIYLGFALFFLPFLPYFFFLVSVFPLLPILTLLVSILCCRLQILFFGSEIAVPLQLNLLFSMCWQQSEM